MTDVSTRPVLRVRRLDPKTVCHAPPPQISHQVYAPDTACDLWICYWRVNVAHGLITRRRGTFIPCWCLVIYVVVVIFIHRDHNVQSIQPTLKADEYQLCRSLNETETPLWNFRESSNPGSISRCRSCRPRQAKVYLLTVKQEAKLSLG